MGIFRRISQLREEQILSHAEPYLEGDEQVVHWVRAARTEGRGRGLLFLTTDRVILHWTRGEEDSCDAAWEHIEAWGINTDARGGPVLAIEAEEIELCAQMSVSTPSMAHDVKTFLHKFASFAPSPKRTLVPKQPLGDFHPHPNVEISPEKKGVAGHTMRVLVTILGVVMVVGGIVITPLPGPWSLPLIIGGLAVLATEYDWADDLLDWVKRRSRSLADKIRNRRRASDAPKPPPK